jgi:hypothetical protein
MEPQEETPQLTFQVTPAPVLSLATEATIPVVALVASELGGAVRNETEIGPAGGFELEPLHPTTKKARRHADRAP